MSIPLFLNSYNWRVESARFISQGWGIFDFIIFLVRFSQWWQLSRIVLSAVTTSILLAESFLSGFCRSSICQGRFLFWARASMIFFSRPLLETGESRSQFAFFRLFSVRKSAINSRALVVSSTFRYVP